MPIPVGLARINIRAALEGGEQMVHTLYGTTSQGAGFPVTPEAAGLLAQRFAAAWSTSFQSQVSGQTIFPLFSQQTRYNQVDAYLLGTDLRSRAQGTAPLEPDLVRGTAANSIPNEIAMAVTFDSTRAGRTGRGRIYLGGFANSVLDTNGRFLPAATRAVSLWWRDFLQGVNNATDADPMGADFSARVVSRVAQDEALINRIRVGDVPDVQRRRRNRLRENYAQALMTS